MKKKLLKERTIYRKTSTRLHPLEEFYYLQEERSRIILTKHVLLGVLVTTFRGLVRYLRRCFLWLVDSRFPTRQLPFHQLLG